MCESGTSTVMTTIPKLRMTLRKSNFVKTAPKTTRDPTYASKQKNNYAQMLIMLHEKRTSNMYTAPPAPNQILRGDVSRAQATKKDPHQDKTTSKPDMKVCHGSGDRYSNSDGYREEYNDYKQTMQEKKECRTNTAPPGPNRTTSSDNCDKRPPGPKAEGMKLVATVS